MRSLFALFAPALLTVAGLAQGSTWIVDASGGPGARFTDIQPAVVTAQPGDRILVRTGSYREFQVSKALSIVGVGAPVVSIGAAGSVGVTIQNLPAGSQLSITNLGLLVSGTATSRSLSITNCQGAVVLDRVTVGNRTVIDRCTDVRGRRCTFGPVLATASAVTLDRCAASGGFDLPIAANHPALELVNGTACLSRCRLTGAPLATGHIFVASATPAIELAGGGLVLTDDGSGLVAGGTGTPTAAIAGTGALELDPHVVLQSNAGQHVAATVTQTTRPIPSLAVDVGPPGASVDADYFGIAGRAYALFVGWTAPPFAVAQMAGSAWIRPVLIWRLGALPASARVLGQVPLPNSPDLAGYSFTWQGIMADGAGTVASNPVSYVHGL